MLGRRVISNLLTIYLPTFLICLVSFSTNYYQSSNFEVLKPLLVARKEGNFENSVSDIYQAIVTVNLTSLLVMTTLFISVSDSLPKTSYVKMVDVWHLLTMCVPFVEVLLHAAMDNLEGKEEGKTRAAMKQVVTEIKVHPQVPFIEKIAKKIC